MSDSQQKAFRARKAKRVYSPEERRQLAKRGYVRGQVHEGIGLFMVRRKEEGLGTYQNTHHVVFQKERELFYANQAELSEIAGVQKRIPMEGRTERGTFAKGYTPWNKGRRMVEGT